MKEWQFNILFFVAVGGAVLMFFAPEIGLEELGKNPTALAGVGTILTYVLTQKKSLTKHDDKPKGPDSEVPQTKKEDEK